MKPPSLFYDIAARLVRLAPAERAHGATVAALQGPLAPKASGAPDPMLKTSVAGLSLSNPVGLAAGFDKNAEVPNAMLNLGFGFVEVGAVTPEPQPGNPQPRVFRLSTDRGVINRLGFNNGGLAVAAARLKARPRRGVVGVNLGANKTSADRTADYVAGLSGLAGLVDFYTVNISSPNTPGLRALQGRDALEALLERVLAARAETGRPETPVFLKVAPDLTDEDKADIAALAETTALDGLIVSNTTVSRPEGLASPYRGEAGGLSGRPLFRLSTEVLRDFYKATKGRTPLIGVGGVASARDAYEKILAGASLVQLYTAMIYEGPGLPARIVRDLPGFLRADGFDSIGSAVGAEFR